MFGAIFMATDPVTSPTTPIGQVLYGLFLGILTVIFRYLTPYPEGVLTSILTMNMFVFILDRIGSKARFNFNKSILSFFLAWALILLIGCYIGNTFVKEDETDNKDPNFEIVSKNVVDKVVTYTVTQKGFSGKIKARIVIDDGLIKTIDILEQNDSYFQKIIDANYIDKLIREQETIEKVDTISGVTISSTAVKKMVINTLADYKESGYAE